MAAKLPPIRQAGPRPQGRAGTSHPTGSAFPPARPDDSIAWLRVTPFIVLHLACIAPLWVGASRIALVVAVVSYAVRAFAVSVFYHRCFSHRAFRTHRAVQFVFGFLGAAATQRGPLWWAGHHRLHHAHADTGADPHSSPRGFWWSHMRWFLTRGNFPTPLGRVGDLARFPELAWLDRFDLAAPGIFAGAMFAAGAALPGTDGWQMLAWGYVIPTVALMHATFLVNSLSHRIGRRPFATADGSRSIAWLALLTCGEGWHNNHHRHAASARLGFYWWQLDLGWLGLRLLAALGLAWDLKTPPQRVLDEGSGCA